MAIILSSELLYWVFLQNNPIYRRATALLERWQTKVGPCPSRGAGVAQSQKRGNQPSVRFPSCTTCVEGQVLHKSQHIQEEVSSPLENTQWHGDTPNSISFWREHTSLGAAKPDPVHLAFIFAQRSKKHSGTIPSWGRKLMIQRAVTHPSSDSTGDWGKWSLLSAVEMHLECWV